MSANNPANVKKKTVQVGDKKLEIEVAGNQVKVKDGNSIRYFKVEEITGENVSKAFTNAANKPANNTSAAVTTNAAAAAAAATTIPPATVTTSSVAPPATSTATSGGRRRRTRRTRRRR